MNQFVKVSLFLGVCLFSYQSFASEDGLTCLGKQNVLQTEIEYAKQAKNTNRLRGLEKALSDVQTYCTNQDLEKKYKDDILDKLKDLKDDQDKLIKAKQQEKASKIGKYEQKMRQSEVELRHAQEKLDAFYKVLESEAKK